MLHFSLHGAEYVKNGLLEIKSLEWVNTAPWFYTLTYIKSVLDVGMMFIGRDNSYLFYNLPLSQNPFIVCLFWLIHLMAFYTSATAILIVFGNDLLRWIRIMTSKISDVDLIFGINPDSLVFGRNITGKKRRMLVYVDSNVGGDYENSVNEMKGLIYSDYQALKATPEFIRRIRIKPNKTKLRLFALSSDYDKNLQYAQMMLESLQKTGISPEQTELVLLGTDELKGMIFQSDKNKADNHYGYGNVVSFDEFEISARLLIHEYPLCDAVKFDEDGRATEDMHVLIVGFGRIGHEVLRKIIANGQFEGSRFSATIYDPNIEHKTGFFTSQYPNIQNNYKITFESQNGRSSQIFQFIDKNASKLKYIVICIKDRDTARDIAIQMVDRLKTLGCPRNVYTCDPKGIRCYSSNPDECATHWIYDSEILYSGELDRYAMELNHRYSKGKDANSDWKNCDYFGRMSSRAAVDYLVPLIQKIKNGKLSNEQRENLAKSEHMRWCAFHYTFGFYVMDKEEFTERVKAYKNEIERYGKSKIKMTKDMQAMKHVCLVDWDELDDISQIENSITHGNRNYKDSDRENVDMIDELIN